MTTNPVQTLTEVRSLLSDSTAWIKGRFSDRHQLNQQDIKATKWCLAGALAEVTYRSGGSWYGPRDLIAEACGGSIAQWNDRPERTHAEVLALLDRVILEQTPKEAI